MKMGIRKMVFGIAPIIVLFWGTGCDPKTKDLRESDIFGKWCANNFLEGEYLVLDSNGTFVIISKNGQVVSDSANAWELIKDGPLAPAISLTNFLAIGGSDSKREGGVFPLSTDKGAAIFIVNDDKNHFFSKCN